MKKLIILAALAVFPILVVRAVFALDSSQVTFPIADLGNCASAEECKQFCTQPVNQTACSTYAQTHNLKPAVPEKETLLMKAKELLGCTDLASCKSFCGQAENRERCKEFGKTIQTLIRPNQKVDPVAIFFAATQKELGCNSAESCKTFCETPQNATQCLHFLARHGFGGLGTILPKPTSTPLATPAGIKRLPPYPTTTP